MQRSPTLEKNLDKYHPENIFVALFRSDEGEDLEANNITKPVFTAAMSIAQLDALKLPLCSFLFISCIFKVV